jgi:hypothetical protein
MFSRCDGIRKDGAVWVEQGKTKARLQIDIVGELATVIERIKSRGIVGMTLLCDPKGAEAKTFRVFQESVRQRKRPGREKSS